MGKYAATVVAGTFDHLHDGHRQLLNRAVSLTRSGGGLVVGITTEALQSKKELSELIEPYENRRAAVESFIRQLANSKGLEFNFEFVPISEVVPQRGATDPSLECIVVSAETQGGAEALNRKRLANGVKALEVAVVEMVAEAAVESEEKLSSTLLRKRSLGTFVPRSPLERLKRGPLSCPPFMIGLTGGIACGKSLVRELLRKCGAHTIDCDALAHRSYEPHTPTFQSLVKTFGSGILKPGDGTVDRLTLGKIVFSDANAMARLTSIVWPAVRRLVVEEKEALGEQGVRFCVAEAALMLEARSDKEMDEVWVVFASKEQACERLMKRNNLNEEEAEKRMKAQMTSRERLTRADVAIYNGWTVEETEQQVQRAWMLLKERTAPMVERWQQGLCRHPLWPRWVGLMERLGVEDGLTLQWWNVLDERYTSTWRCYHNLDELHRLYKLYHKYSHFIAEPMAVQLAIFFHAVCYEPQGVASEMHQPSKHFFEGFAEAAQLTHTIREKVADCFRFEEDAGDSSGFLEGDAAWFHDFKLGVFCEAWEDVKSIAERWRRELDLLNVRSSAERQAAYLQSLLERPSLFATLPWQSEHGAAAKHHIERLIQELL